MLKSKRTEFFSTRVLLAWVLVFILGISIAAFNKQPVSAANTSFKFDFGSGTLETGYTKILNTTAYSSSVGYGFASTSGLATRDRGAPDALKEDFVFYSSPFTFNVDVANGDYDVKVICGDQIAAQASMSVAAEGTTQFTASAAAGSFIERTFTVTITDGQLNVTFSGGNPARINAMEIYLAGTTPTPTPTPSPTPAPTPIGPRQMENIDRGTAAVQVNGGIFVSWRVLGTEASGVSYNLYRGGTKINSSPITEGTNYLDTSGTANSTYSVSAIVNGVEQALSTPVSVWGSNYLSVPLQIPAGGTTPDGVAYTYSANDCSVGDLNGDGQYEIVLKWDPSNSKDNSESGYTGNVYLDAYTLTGIRLWRIDLGINIRAGAHYTQFMVYDLDGDGKAEVACKTADGTKDGTGTIIGSSTADYRNSSGYILSGPEFLTIFEGATGRILTTTNYEPARGTVSSWGDSYGNRVDRFLACIAYLDGTRPSLVMCRGYYTRSVLVAYDWRNGTLTKKWTFDSDVGYSSYAGQGNHNLSVADVDSDYRDEIVYGSCTIDHNGSGLFTTGIGHGDAMHVGDLDPNRAGLEIWQCHEGSKSGTFRGTSTSSTIFQYSGSTDIGRACAGDIDPNYLGEEVWCSGSPLYSSTGANIGSAPSPKNFAIWWDGDLSRELNDNITISKWNYTSHTTSTLLNPTNCASNNSTKATPCLQADLFGDWREEVIWRTADNTALRIYTTTDATSTRIYTLMHDPVYRLGIAWQNVAYNQPPHTGFYLGTGMTTPPAPDIYFSN